MYVIVLLTDCPSAASASAEGREPAADYGDGGSQRWTSGGRLSHAIFSFMPLAIGPQAVECAVRVASDAEEPLAFEQFRWPLNTTHTSHVASWADIVLVQKMAPKPAISSRVMIVFR